MKTTIFRKPTDDEIRVLEAAGNMSRRLVGHRGHRRFRHVADDRLQAARACTHRPRHGTAQLGGPCNYDIGDNVTIENVTALECRCESSFGNGVKVATMNENEGRSVTIYEGLTAQAGYLAAVYRHRSRTVARLTEMAEAIAAAHRSHIDTSATAPAKAVRGSFGRPTSGATSPSTAARSSRTAP